MTDRKPGGRDQVYSQPLDRVPPFEFSARVVDVFPDMIRRSVPGYASVLEMIGVIARQHVQSDSRCYDLGCSLGAALLAVRHNVADPTVELIGVDNSPAMVARCRSILERDGSPVPAQVIEGDIRKTTIERASLVIMNYTLQFLPRDDRLPLLARVHAGLLPGGALVLSEKIEYDDPDLDRRLSDLHHAFKRANGYSDLEVAQKRAALENVLVRDTLQAHEERLTAAGFASVTPWFQSCNFISLLAVR